MAARRMIEFGRTAMPKSAATFSMPWPVSATRAADISCRKCLRCLPECPPLQLEPSASRSLPTFRDLRRSPRAQSIGPRRDLVYVPTMTVAPAFESILAVAKPMRLIEPVTRAVFPLRSIFILLVLLREFRRRLGPWPGFRSHQGAGDRRYRAAGSSACRLPAH